MARTQTVVPRDEAQVLEELGGKQKRDTEKIPTFETDESVFRETGAQREIAEDITGEDGKVIRSHREPLEKHRARGSAKMKSGARKKPAPKKPPKKKSPKKKPPKKKSAKKPRK